MPARGSTPWAAAQHERYYARETRGQRGPGRLKSSTFIFLVVIVGILICSVPSKETLLEYLHNRGGLSHSIRHYLKVLTGLDVAPITYYNVLVGAIAKVDGRWYIGALFNKWLRIPTLDIHAPKLPEFISDIHNPSTLGLMALNCAIFLAWWRDPHTMEDHFTVSGSTLSARPWTLLTSIFSHQSFIHLLSNMLALHAIAPTVSFLIGEQGMVNLYIVGGVCASLFSICAREFLFYLKIIQTPPSMKSLGASGAICAMVAFCYTYLGSAFAPGFPKAIRPDFLHVMAPLLWSVMQDAFFTTRTVVDFRVQHVHTVNWLAHLGGYLFGWFITPHIDYLRV